jgi:CIC family chloride channel protein
MGAFLAGAVHCPITAFLLLFEITSDYHIILPLMVSCSMSTLVAKLVREESIYTLQLLRRGIDVRQREANIMQAFTVGHVMRHEVPALQENAPFAEIVQYFLTSEMPVCFVVDEHQHLRGEISIHDIKAILQEDTLGPLVIARDLAQRPGVTTSPDETLARCLEKFTAAEQEYLPVVSPSLELRGIISHRDVLDLYNREILRHEYLGLSLRSEGILSSVHERVRLPHEYIVEVVQVPPLYVGKTLRDTQLRTRFNLTAVAIRRGGFNSPDELPDPARRLERQDHLVLVGRSADLQRFTAESAEQVLSPR